MNIHIMPNDDIYPHDNDSISGCECEPVIKFVEGGVLSVHNAWDGREIFEELENNKEGMK